MEDVSRIIFELKEVAENPRKSVIKSINETGKKAVGCFPIYAPEEIVYAAGMIPIGMWGGQTTGNLSDKYLQGFCCSIMRINTEQALLGMYDILSAVIVTTYCDTLKCIAENWKVALPQHNIIPIVYPQNRKIRAGREYLREEFQRLINEIQKVTTTEITDEDLTESMDIYDDFRRTMNEFVELVQFYQETFDAKTRHLIIKASYFMDKKIYTKKIKKLIFEIRKQPVEETGRKKLIITGLISEPKGILDIFEENNFIVVADDLAHESRQFRTISPRMGDALDRMVERIALQDGCAFLYDDAKTRGQMLIDMVNRYKADGIVFYQLKFCDPEEFDYPIIKKEIEEKNIPALHLEVEQTMESIGQIRTRIQSFAEVLLD